MSCRVESLEHHLKVPKPGSIGLGSGESFEEKKSSDDSDVHPGLITPASEDPEIEECGAVVSTLHFTLESSRKAFNGLLPRAH